MALQYVTPRRLSSIKDLTGKVFGRLTILELLGIKVGKRSQQTYWKAQCICGTIVEVPRHRFVGSQNNSCGCFQKEILAKYRKQGNDKQKELQTKPPKLRYFNMYKAGATKRGHTFNLTQDQFSELIIKNCYYCKSVPEYKKTVRDIFNGVDRVNSSKGYEIGNVVPCCETCNKAKLDSSQEEFYAWIEKVYKGIKSA